MRASVNIVSLFFLLPSLVFSSPLEIDPRDPESGCIALCGYCPCPYGRPNHPPPPKPNPQPSPKPPSTPLPSPPSTPPQPPSSSDSPPATAVSGSQQSPKNFFKGEQPYAVWVNKSSPTIQNALGTWLYGYDGCKAKSAAYKDNIDEAYYDSWTMANVEGVVSDINWNEAPALEFLGAPGNNKEKQAQIQAVFGNVATVIYSYVNPLTHYIHVRCDDIGEKCEKRPDNDPCNPDPGPIQPSPPQNTPLAYSTNDGGDGYPLINFCNGFFARRSLSNAIAYGTAQPQQEKYKIKNFDNRALTLFHELTHLDLAANSPSPNPRVKDLSITIEAHDGGLSTVAAYGPLFTKILARFTPNVGYYVQRNADNLAYFALAKYVMTQNNNIYPHLPIVTNEIIGPPFQDSSLQGSVAQFVEKDGGVALNNASAADFAALKSQYSAGGPGDDYPGCSDTLDPTSEPALKIDKLADSSAYPDDYNKAVSSWLSDLGTQTG